MIYKISETEERCANCIHFHQHYVRNKMFFDKLTTANIGHCVYPRTKFREPWDSCKHFKQRNFIEGDLMRKVRIEQEREIDM